ncbi:hypothetical protein [Aeromonas enteropelogenes]|uniref:hypothetical protein n=1 Tax=Aeromonas enteropelogenes TaxID=29489 RepID=UPI003B9FB33A
MPKIDIVTMRGMVPRVEGHLLPNEAATMAKDCHFDRGIITPIMGDLDAGIAFPFVPGTIFHYYGDVWLAWQGEVEVMRSPIAQDQYNRIYYTDGEYPKVTYDVIASGGDVRPTAWYRLGVPAPDTPPNVLAITPPVPDEGTELVDDPTDDETRYYVETYVTGLGEEGPPGPASVKATIVYPDSTIEVGLSPAPTNDNNITARRLYRSVSGGGVADYLLVEELPIATTTYTDVKSDTDLGPVLETYGYTVPPDGMRGICQMANGICAGFIDNTVLFSEPYLPYAWPDANKMTTEHNIVAIAAVDTALVVGTEGYPYIMEGASPAAITSQKLSHVQQACISSRSMVALDGLVLYAGPDGLVGIGGDGGQVVTEAIVTREQWQAITPSTIRAWYHEGKYVALSDTHAFVYDPKSGDLRWLSGRWDAGYADLQLDALMIAKGTELYQWRGGSDAVAMQWRSKLFEMPPGVQMNTIRVKSDDVSRIALSVIVEGVSIVALPAGSVPAHPFKIPSVRGEMWQLEVSGTAPVRRLTMGSNMREVSTS